MKLLCFGAACLLAGGELAMAQAPRYRILIIDPPSGFTHTEGLGLNEAGAIVGRYSNAAIPDHSSNRAFVWLLNAAFGQSAKTLIDLNNLTGDSSSTRSIARDINTGGQIAGERKASTSETHAAVWDIADSTPFFDDLGTFTSLTSGKFAVSRAFRINDDDPPLVVGISGATVCENPCPCPGCESCVSPLFLPQTLFRGFRKQFDGTDLDPDTDMLFPLLSEDGYTGAFGVNNGGRAVGQSHPCPSQGEVLVCDSKQDAGQWQNSSAGNLLVAEFDCTVGAQFIETQHQALGINDADNIVGSGFETIECDPECSSDCEGGTCVQRAMFWEDPGSTTTPFVLGTIDTGVVPFDNQSRAEAINNPLESDNCVQVVGADIDDGFGLLWERDVDGDWTVEKLDDMVWECSGLTGIIINGQDINDKGWIVGTMNLTPGGAATLRAVLLVCLADLNASGTVDGIDLGIMLANWSDPPSEPGCGGVTPCDPDLNCDGFVNGIDLGILLANWGDGGCRPDCPVEEEMSGFSAEDVLTPSVLSYIEALIAEDEIEAAVEFLETLMGS